MSSKCGRCNEVLQGKDELDASCCCLCKKKYHFECNTVSESSWRTMGPNRRGAWKCSFCKEKNSTESTNAANKTPKSSEQLVAVNIPTTIEELGRRFALMEATLSKDIRDLKDSLDFHGGIVEDLTKTIKNIETKNVLIEKRLSKQEAENVELKTRVKELEGLMHQQEQRQQATKIEISGLKSSTTVSEVQLVQKMIELAGLAGENIQFKAEKIIKQPKDNQTGSQSVVVEFKSEEVRSDVLSKVKEHRVYSKLADHIQNGGSIYCNEYLTPYYKKLMYEARKIKIDKNYAYLWVKKGKILLKKQKESRIETLSCMSDLSKM